MKFKFAASLSLLACLFLTTGFFGTSIEDVVRDSDVPGTNKTLGKILDQYKYAINPKWSVQKTKDGSQYVEFKATYAGRDVVDTLFKDSNLPPKVIEYLSSLPSQIYIAGAFFTDKKKITNAFIQITDKDGKAYVPMSLPMGIFTSNAPVPETFLTTECKSFYNYNFVKLAFSEKYKSGFSFYSLYPPNDSLMVRLPIRIDVKNIIYDDSKLTIKLSGEISLLEQPLSFLVKNENGRNVYFVNDKQVDGREAFHDIRTYGTGLANIFPSLLNAKPLQIIPIEAIGDFNNGSLVTQSFDVQTKGLLRIIYSSNSKDPFKSSWRLMYDSDKIFNPEIKAYLTEIESMQNNWVRMKAMSNSGFGNGTQKFHYGKGIRNDGISSTMIIMNDKRDYDLDIFYNADDPKNINFTLHINNDCTVKGKCKAEISAINCEYKNNKTGETQMFSFNDNDFIVIGNIHFCNYKEPLYLEYKGIETVTANTAKQNNATKSATQQDPTNEKKVALNDNRFMPGRYVAHHEGEEVILQFYVDGTGYISGRHAIYFEWKEENKQIVLTFNSESEDSDAPAVTEIAQMTSSSSLTYDNQTFKLSEDTIPDRYSYQNNGYSGVLYIQHDEATGDEEAYTRIETFNTQTKDRCYVTASWRKEEDTLLCTVTSNENTASDSFSITFLNNTSVNVESDSDNNNVCGKTAKYIGEYKKMRK